MKFSVISSAVLSWNDTKIVASSSSVSGSGVVSLAVFLAVASVVNSEAVSAVVSDEASEVSSEVVSVEVVVVTSSEEVYSSTSLGPSGLIAK